jgi:hypothetical protein
MFLKFLIPFLISLSVNAAYMPVTEVSGTVRVDVVSGTINVSTSGTSTAANQVIGNNYLASILGLVNDPIPGSAVLLGAKDVSDGDVLAPLTVDGGGQLIITDPNGTLGSEQAIQTTILNSIDSKLTGPISVSNTSFATSTKQDISNTWLNDIDGYVSSALDATLSTRATEATLNSLNLKTPNMGQALAASSTPVVLTASQLSTLTPLSSVTANIGTTNGLALDSSLTTLNTSVNTLLKPASTLTKVTTVDTITNAVTVNTHAVTQSGGPWSVSSTGTASVNFTNTSITANAGTNLNTSSLNLESTQTAMSAKLPASLGSKAGSASFSVVPASDGVFQVSGTVSAQASGTYTIAGTVTANAGTNLNTSALALESGGNLASIKTDADNLNLSQGSTTSGQKGNLNLGAVTTGAPSYTTAQSSPLSLDLGGNLRVVATPSGTTTVSVTGTPSVNATLSAETTKVIGTVNVSSGQSITANAGTNLNTSALALETGGNLATVKTNTDNLALAQASTTSGQKGNLVLTATTTGAPTYVTAQSNPLSTDTLGNLRVVATPSGTTTVSVSNIPHVIADSGSTTAVTGNVTVTQSTNSSLKADVTSNAANIATEASLAKLTQTQGSSTSGQSGPLVQAAVTTGAPSYTTAQTSPLSVDLSGNLRVVNTASGSTTVAQSTATNLKTQAESYQGGSAVSSANPLWVQTSGTGMVVSQGTATNLKAQAENYQGGSAVSTSNPLWTQVSGTASVNQIQMNGVAISTSIGPTGTGTQRIIGANVAAATMSSVAASTTTQVLFSSNASRMNAIAFNDSTANLYIAYAATASATSAVTYKVLPGQYWRIDQPAYSGVISGIWDAVNGKVWTTEY